MIDETLRVAALAIARHLAAAAEPSRHGLTWHAEIVVEMTESRPIIGFGDVGAALYEGTAGIALVLAAASTVADPLEAERLATVASAAAAHALAHADEMLGTARLGLHSGATGIAYGTVVAGRLLADASLVARGRVLAQAIAARVSEPGPLPTGSTELDLIGGLAGMLLGLQAIAHVCGEAPPVALLATGAERLAAAARPQLWGSAWPVEAADSASIPLLGLAHGAAGIALALGEIAGDGIDCGASWTCAEALEYERGWFDPVRVAWPDLRESAEGVPSSWMAAWCHGAIGIGLSRLRLFQLTQEVRALAEASATLQAGRNLVVVAGTALRAGHTSDCTACHGLAGVVELFLVAAESLGVAEHGAAARHTAHLLLEERAAADGGWPCGLIGAGEVPGLMTGTAGIALTLLRAAGAIRLPTPLLPGPTTW